MVEWHNLFEYIHVSTLSWTLLLGKRATIVYNLRFRPLSTWADFYCLPRTWWIDVLANARLWDTPNRLGLEEDFSIRRRNVRPLLIVPRSTWTMSSSPQFGSLIFFNCVALFGLYSVSYYRFGDSRLRRHIQIHTIVCSLAQD